MNPVGYYLLRPTLSGVSHGNHSTTATFTRIHFCSCCGRPS